MQSSPHPKIPPHPHSSVCPSVQEKEQNVDWTSIWIIKWEGEEEEEVLNGRSRNICKVSLRGGQDSTGDDVQAKARATRNWSIHCDAWTGNLKVKLSLHSVPCCSVGRVVPFTQHHRVQLFIRREDGKGRDDQLHVIWQRKDKDDGGRCSWEWEFGTTSATSTCPCQMVLLVHRHPPSLPVSSFCRCSVGQWMGSSSQSVVFCPWKANSTDYDRFRGSFRRKSVRLRGWVKKGRVRKGKSCCFRKAKGCRL